MLWFSFQIYPETLVITLPVYLEGLYTVSSISVEMLGSTFIGFWY